MKGTGVGTDSVQTEDVLLETTTQEVLQHRSPERLPEQLLAGLDVGVCLWLQWNR